MKFKPLVLGLAVASLVLGAPAAAAGAATPMHVVAKQTAVGAYAVAMGAGNATRPARMELVLTAKPRQAAEVSWDLVCTENSGGVGSTMKQRKVVVPTVIALKPPAPSASCIASASAQLAASGSLTVAIED
jgi:hypothetical protein